jgi:hypothetical protein
MTDTPSNAAAQEPSAETVRVAEGYLTALGQDAKAEAARLGHDFVYAHYIAGTDPYTEERAAKIQPNADDAAPAGAAAGSAPGTAAPVIPAAIETRIQALETKADPAAQADLSAINERVKAIEARFADAGDVAGIESRVTALEEKVAAKAAAAAAAPSAADLDAAAAETNTAAETAAPAQVTISTEAASS